MHNLSAGIFRNLRSNSTRWTRLSLFCLLIVSLTACHIHPLEKAKQQVAIGTLREDAIQILNKEAWYHQPCTNVTTVDDLFFYGSHKYDKAEVVIMRSTLNAGTYKVTELGSFEANAWHSAYADCVDRRRFE